MNSISIKGNSIQSPFQAKPDESINMEQFKAHYKKFPERWNTTFKFLTETDLKSLPIGRIDLSDDVYAAVSEYETKNPEDAKFESHQKYIDLQYLISGEEQIGLTNEKSMPVNQAYSEEKDITFYNYSGGKLLTADPSRYFIFFPSDKHRPCIKIGEKGMVKKVVMKIKSD
ncbi:YhcH/YjgK/YiaL family protein [uncultured Draconibacterium sp.]|uniref:YhcH/YjgK/YiaL family protein n=1 Tax=uncultured Draconibacterium sp. TaxID=1573823 RepID=UPI0029C783EA|nr:YhcH/YjgK/YiaL family protein [uncultured Draconibacterium sp.]